MCVYSVKCRGRALELGISNVTAILGGKCTAWLKVNLKTRSPPLSENLNLEKELLSCLRGYI